MGLSKYLRDYSRSIAGKEQLLIGALARSLENIPRQLCDNAGFDSNNILNKLRQKHAQGECWYGVDVYNEDIADNLAAFVWEPSIVKINALLQWKQRVSFSLWIKPLRTRHLLMKLLRVFLVEGEVAVVAAPCNPLTH